MTNEKYLIVSYFTVAALAVILGVLVYFFLRRPFSEIAETVRGRTSPRLWKRLFPFGLVLPALLGFVSVSYRGCDLSYDQIVQNRSYLIQKNQEQISTSLLSILIAVVFWDVVVLLFLKIAQNGTQKATRSTPPSNLATR